MLTGCCAPFSGAQGKQELRKGSLEASSKLLALGLAAVFSGYPAATEVGFMHGQEETATLQICDCRLCCNEHM